MKDIIYIKDLRVKTIIGIFISDFYHDFLGNSEFNTHPFNSEKQSSPVQDSTVVVKRASRLRWEKAGFSHNMSIIKMHKDQSQIERVHCQARGIQKHLCLNPK